LCRLEVPITQIFITAIITAICEQKERNLRIYFKGGFTAFHSLGIIFDKTFRFSASAEL
jgi:hypothetical protein